MESLEDSFVSVTSRRRHAPPPKPALVGSSRRPETATAAIARGPVASAPAVAEESEPVPDVPPRFKDANSDQRGLKQKSGEDFQHPIDKKAKTVDASSSEEEEYPHRWPDFDWECPGLGPKVTYELNFPRVRIFAECSEDSDEENCMPLTRKRPPNAEIERMVEDLRVMIKRWVYFYP